MTENVPKNQNVSPKSTPEYVFGGFHGFLGTRFRVMRAQSSRNWGRSAGLRRVAAQAAESSLRVMLVLGTVCTIHSLPGGLV